MLRLAPPIVQEAALAPPPPSLSRLSLVVSPTLAVGRTTLSATVSRAPPSPPLVFVTPVGPAPPPYTLCSGSLSHAPPRMLVPLFPSITPPPSPVHGTLGNMPAPRPVSQWTPRPPAPTPVASLSCCLIPSIASPHPSTVCPSPWAGCWPRLLLGLKVVSHMLRFR